ncbi:juxtaposed with another zinc finger protein 1 [Anabrus simplex]|uniref:juxtaposed with another zinc finger protein 1 n=1 Tax=Anabrus simplex TaxID=316456 RepID=UPI0035A272EC
MAVFMVNICKYNGCGLIFSSLGDLIQHIEDTHIDYDPHVVEQKEQQQPACLPLSYVLRFFTDAARKELLDSKRKLAQNHANKISTFGSVRSNTPTGSEADEEEVISESEDSNDSWTTNEEFSAEFILRYGSRMLSPSNQTNNNNNIDKPFACPVPGCKKRYKNVNGIKYHSKNGHKKDGKVRKGFKCHCGKSYKTGQGLRNHMAMHHNGVNLTMVSTHSSEVLQIPTGHMTALQPLRTVALKTIQGLVVATKPSVQFVSPQKAPLAGLGSCTASPEQQQQQQTLSTTLGVLTPAASPQTPPADTPQLTFLPPSSSPVPTMATQSEVKMPAQ